MNDIPAPFLRAFAESARLKRLAAGVLVEPFERAAGLMENALRGGRKVLACGNGGSAGDAQHLAAEMVNRFEGERPALPAIALTTDSAVLTSIANDDSYERVFARQVEALGAPGDVLVAISTSGRSPSVLRAVEAARARGLAIIALVGKDGGGLPALLGPEDAFLTVPEDRTARIQEVHLLLIHCLCERMDAVFGVAPPVQPAPSGTATKIHRDWTTLRAAAGRFRPLVFTNGVFDILHRGHVSYLEEARALGACLAVGVNDDDSVRRLGKGPDRPVNPLEDRMALLAALEAVDFVVPFSEDTPQELIEFLAPDVLVKGGDWPPQQIVGADFVLGRGGRVYAIPFAFERSTTGLLRRVRGEET